MRLAMLLMLAPALLLADSLLIISPGYQVLAGASLKLGATVFDNDGKPLSAAPSLTWTSASPAVATVSSDGTVSGVSLGITRIRASAPGGLADDTFVQVLPKRIRVTPAGAVVRLGATQQFTAEVLDSRDRPLAGVALQWLVNNGVGFATVSPSGLLTARTAGRSSVRAQFLYNGPQYAMSPVVYADADFTIVPAPSYSVTEVPVSAVGLRQATIGGRAGYVGYSSETGLLFTAALEGLTGGLLSQKDGELKVVRKQGIPSVLAASYVRAQGVVTSNDAGTTLVGETSGSWPTVVLINGGRQDTIAILNTLVGNSAVLWAPYINTNSLSRGGQVVIWSEFRTLTQPNRLITGLFRGFRGRFGEAVVTTGAKFPELPGPFVLDNSYGIADDSTVYFTLSQGQRRFVYRCGPDGVVTALFGTGTQLGSRVIRTVAAGSGEVPPFRVAAGGDLALAVNFEDGGTSLLRFANGAFEAPVESVAVNNAPRAFAFDDRFGSLWEASTPAGGTGLYRWKEGKLDLVLRYSSGVDGTAVSSVASAVFDSEGRVIVSTSLGDRGMAVVRIDPAGKQEIQVRAGDKVTTDAPVSITALIGGASAGGLQVVTAHASIGSITEIREDGQAVPLLTTGTVLPDGSIFGGVGSGFGQWSVRKSPDGQIFFAGAGIYTLDNGIPRKFSAARSNLIYPNGTGEVAWVISDQLGLAGKPGSLLGNVFSSPPAGTTTSIEPFGRVLAFGSIALDDVGRLLTGITFEDGRDTLAYWDGSSWRVVAIPGVTELSGRRIASIDRVRAKGNHLYASFTMAGGLPSLAEWDGADWKVLLPPGFVLPNGLAALTISRFDPNRNEEIAIRASGTYSYVAVLTKSGLKLVYDSVAKPPEETYASLGELDFRDDGTVYFLTFDAYDRQRLLMAKPLP